MVIGGGADSFCAPRILQVTTGTASTLHPMAWSSGSTPSARCTIGSGQKVALAAFPLGHTPQKLLQPAIYSNRFIRDRTRSSEISDFAEDCRSTKAAFQNRPIQSLCFPCLGLIVLDRQHSLLERANEDISRIGLHPPPVSTFLSRTGTAQTPPFRTRKVTDIDTGTLNSFHFGALIFCRRLH